MPGMCAFPDHAGTLFLHLKEVRLRLFLYSPSVFPVKKASCLTICPLPCHESLAMPESIGKVVFTIVFDGWFVTLKDHLLYFPAWTTHNIPVILPHLHSWAEGFCFFPRPFWPHPCTSQSAVSMLLLSPFSPLRLVFSWICYFHHPESWQSLQEKEMLSAAEFSWQGEGFNQRRLSIFTTKYPTSDTCILRSSNSGLYFPVSPCPRCIPALHLHLVHGVGPQAGEPRPWDKISCEAT